MKIKINDKVKVIAGRDQGKSGKVTRALPQKGKVVVEGLNTVKKHVKAGQGKPGQRISVAMPLDISNAMLICPKCGKETRVGYTILGNGEKHRTCKKCKQLIDEKITKA
jgi:large subunit ribosomal protein L24